MSNDKPITLGELHRLKGNPLRTPVAHPPCTPTRIPPYNTGKVKIGIYYVPPQRDLNTEETDHWQNVYLGDYKRSKRAEIGLRLYVIVLVVGFAIGYWFLRGV